MISKSCESAVFLFEKIMDGQQTIGAVALTLNLPHK